MESESICDIARRLTTRDRRDEYGDAYSDFSRIATFWQPIIDAPPAGKITPQKVALCMIALKLSRLCHNPTHRDSIVDIAGYANCMDMINRR